MRDGLRPPMTRLSAGWRTASVWLWVLPGLIGQNALNVAVVRPAWGVPLLAWCGAAVFAGVLVSRGHRRARHLAGLVVGAAIVAVIAFAAWTVQQERANAFVEDMRPVVLAGALLAIGVLIPPIVILVANPNPWRPQPPGWYPNPSAQSAVRWWDGARFTDQTWAGAPSTPAAPPPMRSPGPPARPMTTLETRLRQEPEPDDPGQRPTDFT